MTISFHTNLRSDTVRLPDAAGLVGKDVRIIVVEEPANRPPKDLSALDKLAGKIDLDYDAIENLRRRTDAFFATDGNQMRTDERGWLKSEIRMTNQI
jgi:virulence-associated protein VagC